MAGAYFTTSDLDSAIKPGQDTATGVDGICYSLALNNNQHVIACSVDVEGAYDNIQIEVLVAQMRRLGISECLVKAVYSLFKERLLHAVWMVTQFNG
ncbi:hypothetical protein quinque_013786 [Culex quinquefasciatus]